MAKQANGSFQRRFCLKSEQNIASRDAGTFILLRQAFGTPGGRELQEESLCWIYFRARIVLVMTVRRASMLSSPCQGTKTLTIGYGSYGRRSIEIHETKRFQSTIAANTRPFFGVHLCPVPTQSAHMRKLSCGQTGAMYNITFHALYFDERRYNTTIR